MTGKTLPCFLSSTNDSLRRGIQKAQVLYIFLYICAFFKHVQIWTFAIVQDNSQDRAGKLLLKVKDGVMSRS